MTNTKLFFFWDPQIPRWIGDTICLSLLLPLILLWAKNDEEFHGVENLRAQVWCGAIVGFFLSLSLGPLWALIVGILAVMLLGGLYSWEHERNDFGLWSFVFGPLIWQGYIPGLCLGLGVTSGFAISLWLVLLLIAAPLITISLLMLVLLGSDY